MHPADIQAELKKRDITQKSIAKDLGVSEFHLSEVIHGRRDSDRCMKAIAEKIDRHPYRVFPEYYFKRHNRKKRRAAGAA